MIRVMFSRNISISISASDLEFIEEYRKRHALTSRSQVIEKAIALLREQELESAYREASRAYDPVFEITDPDGLSDEAW